jgi:glycosyltransferase involved in cell wall biosynthesis
MRVALFLDAAFRRDASGRVFAGEELLGFSTFAAAVGERLGGLLLIARRTEDAAATPFELPAGVELAPLPFYSSLRNVGALLGALPATMGAIWRALGDVDGVWVSAGNPVGLIVMALAALRRRRVSILVRQDTMQYFRNRLPSRLWAPMLLPLWIIDRIYRGVARRARTVVVGDRIAAQYRSRRDNVLAITVNLTSERDIPSTPPDRAWEQPVRLLTVGRIEAEKNPLLLVEMLAELERAQPGRFAATWVGSGRLAKELREHAERLGVGERLELPGFVAHGAQLRERYRQADAFVHISLTEGVPGVIVEALACGLPTVATDVGGVRAATADGEAALLVPPSDAGALSRAVLELDADPARRLRLAERGLQLARESSLEVEAERVATFIGGS